MAQLWDKGSSVPVMDGPVSMAIRVIKTTFRELRRTALLLYDFVTELNICVSLRGLSTALELNFEHQH